MKNVAPYLPVLLVVGVLAVTVAVSRARRRRERATLAAQWAWLLREQEARRSAGARLLQVASVYQRARRGSKAQVRWCDSGRLQDAWFEGRHVPPGAFMLVTGQVGWGPHNRIRDVLYVGPAQVHGWVPASAPTAWQREQSAGRSPA
ncbi:hypothetical protein OG455_22000 [Kitasatospora sp. NBC_01287]|uniref:hypothetical protein n=1 Tax=Kitasatospora sp. NBC_01287 TaxID=2903573 RepID=UPI0022507343|nr:hypothetical protein [Kitasatospora sp. NBC_01287]MCX4748151.1 hypothetical protein [Kitasatospora sp. NBC_01287]